MRVFKYQAEMLLILAALIWGSSFVIMKESLNSLSTGVLLAVRFFVASLVIYILFSKKLRSLDLAKTLKGALIGVLLFGAFLVQTLGLMTTTSAKNAFLTAVYVAFLPFLHWLAYRKRPDGYNFLCALMCLGGVGLISLTGTFAVGLGDGLSVLAGFFFACHILAISWFARSVNPYEMAFVSFATTSFLAGVYASLFEGWSSLANIDLKMVFVLGYLAVFCSALALLFQNIGLEKANALTGSLLLSLESVFSVFFSILYGEPVTIRLVAGFAMIFGAIVISTTKLKFLKSFKGEL